MRVFNFSAGPAVLPETVLQRAAAEMLDWHGSGMSVMEMSHRGKEFIAIHAEAERLLRLIESDPVIRNHHFPALPVGVGVHHHLAGFGMQPDIVQDGRHRA